MDAYGYILLGFAICLALVFGVYWLSVWYQDWYNRIHLPKRDPELITNPDGEVVRAYWHYNAEKRIAERQFEHISAPNPEPQAGWPVSHFDTYDQKGNLKP